VQQAGRGTGRGRAGHSQTSEKNEKATGNSCTHARKNSGALRCVAGDWRAAAAGCLASVWREQGEGRTQIVSEKNEPDSNTYLLKECSNWRERVTSNAPALANDDSGDRWSAARTRVDWLCCRSFLTKQENQGGKVPKTRISSASQNSSDRYEQAKIEKRGNLSQQHVRSLITHSKSQ